MITEDVYDMMSIQTLLGQKFDTIQFKHLLPRLKGSALGSEKTKRAILAEFKTSGCAFVIFMMDLDGLASQADLVASKRSLFDSLNALCGGNHLLLLNIWELEAMIFADIEVFNKKYGTAIKGNRNPMFISQPKEELISATYKTKRRFAVSDCPEIFSNLSYTQVVSRCEKFKEFVTQFDKKLGGAV